MKISITNSVMQLAAVTILFTACKKNDDIINQQPLPLPVPDKGYFSVKLKAAITVGEVVYDSIPATFTITTWDVNNVPHSKDTTLNAGAQTIYLSKAASRYSLKLNKWGVIDEKMLNKADVTEGAVYQLGGQKEAKKLKWVKEDRFVNGTFEFHASHQFMYDEKGRINEIHAYAADPNNGALSSTISDIFMYSGNELWVNNIRKNDGTIMAHSAYTFDAMGRIIQSKYQYLTENHIYTNQYTGEGILMLMGKNATDPNGARIALKFTGGNRVEEKTIIPNYPTTVKDFVYDFNINPYVIIKMPGLYFEHSSKNNVVAEGWDGHHQLVNEYKYDTDGYVTEVITKARNNNGQLVNYSRTVFTY